MEHIVNEINGSIQTLRLTAEIEKLNTIVLSMKTKLKDLLTEKDESIKKLTQEKVISSKKNKELVSLSQNYSKKNSMRTVLDLSIYLFNLQAEKVESLEEELKDIEDLRQTVVSLMSKRKKSATKEK